jgi:plasmid stability protein
MRTTVRIDDRLLAAARVRAAASGQTLNAVIEDALRTSLLRRPQGDDRPRIALPVFRGARLLPGVDLDDTAALLDHMEGNAR